MSSPASYTSRIPDFKPDPAAPVRTLGDVGIQSYDCPFCRRCQNRYWQPVERRFASSDALRDLLCHYLWHRTFQMEAAQQPPCPCCGDPLRPHYKPRGEADAAYLLRFPADMPPEVALLQAELDHFLRGSMGVPDVLVRWFADIWVWLAARYSIDEIGRLTFR